MSALGRIVLADNLEVLARLADDSIDLIYVDPPFNTGRRQTLERLRTVRDDADGDRVGFQGRRYRTFRLGTSSYLDVFDDYLEFLEPRLREFHRVLKASGTLYVHLDWICSEDRVCTKVGGHQESAKRIGVMPAAPNKGHRSLLWQHATPLNPGLER